MFTYITKASHCSLSMKPPRCCKQNKTPFYQTPSARDIPRLAPRPKKLAHAGGTCTAKGGSARVWAPRIVRRDKTHIVCRLKAQVMQWSVQNRRSKVRMRSGRILTSRKARIPTHHKMRSKRPTAILKSTLHQRSQTPKVGYTYASRQTSPIEKR